MEEKIYKIDCVYVFDFDDTLIKSKTSFIKVRSKADDSILLKLTPKQYTYYTVSSETEYLDFKDFDQDQIPDFDSLELNKPMVHIFNQAIEAVGKQNVHICSARVNPEPIRMVLNTLLKQEGVNIAAIGKHDLTMNPTQGNAIRKKDYIKQIIDGVILVKKKKSDDLSKLIVYFYDDNLYNLEEVYSLNNNQSSYYKVVCMKVDDANIYIQPYVKSSSCSSEDKKNNGTSTIYMQGS